MLAEAIRAGAAELNHRLRSQEAPIIQDKQSCVNRKLSGQAASQAPDLEKRYQLWALLQQPRGPPSPFTQLPVQPKERAAWIDGRSLPCV